VGLVVRLLGIYLRVIELAPEEFLAYTLVKYGTYALLWLVTLGVGFWIVRRFWRMIKELR